LPDGAWFRFEDCATYRRLNGRSLKEMDFSYWDEAHQCIKLLELKDYYAPPRAIPTELVSELTAKGRHALLMMHAAWHGKGEGATLCTELPEVCRRAVPLQLKFVLKIRKEEVANLGKLQDAIRLPVLVYAELLGLIASVQVLDHARAIKKGLPLADASGPEAPPRE
jgi:hypothetical protein